MNNVINFLKKQTVLNNILTNKNTIVIDNSQLNTFVTLDQTPEQYLISNSEEIINNNISNLSYLIKLYNNQYGVNISYANISDQKIKEIIENIKRYNNVEKSIEVDELKNYYYEFTNNQNTTYNNYNKITHNNSLLLDNSYNLIYYIQNNKLNLMSYVLKQSNGFNYNNHMLYFNIDNEFIRSINNTLYYNYNKIRNTSLNNNGISLIDPNVFVVKTNKQKNNILLLNKEFKYNTFISLNKLKTLYHNCENVRNALLYYININNYDDSNLLNVMNESTSYQDINIDNVINRISYNSIIHGISFQNTKLYYSNSNLGINLLEIDEEDNTLYIDDINNINLKIGYIKNIKDNYNYTYINENNIDLYKNTTTLTVNENNINTKLLYNFDYKYFNSYITANFIETYYSAADNTSNTIIQSIEKENINRFAIGTSYSIKISSNIDKMLFKNSGLSIIYNGSPYLTYYNYYDENNICSYSSDSLLQNNSYTYVITYSYHHHIVIPQSHELNIRTINNKKILNHNSLNISCVKKSFETKTTNNLKQHYYILSSKNLFYTNNLQFIRGKRLLGDNELITNDQINNKYVTKIYLKGTAYDNEYGGNCDECVIKINDGDNLVINSTNRSLHLVTIDKQTHEVIDKEIYDTYGEAGNDSERSNNGITLLKQKLNDIKNDIAPYDDKEVFVCLVSYDAVGWDDELISLLQEFGMSDLPYTDNWRYPFLFIGYKNLGKGNGFTKMNDAGSPPNEVELKIYMNDDTFGTIQIISPNNIQITGLGKYNCYECEIDINKYLFNELYSMNLITKIPNLHYYQTISALTDKNYLYHYEYLPILNKYPSKYLNDKFFDSGIYLDNSYPTNEELNTCISDIKNFKTSIFNNKLYLYEICEYNDRYYLKFYTILNNDLKNNISKSDINNITTSITCSNESKLLYNNQTSNSLLDKNQLYNYFTSYINNFINM